MFRAQLSAGVNLDRVSGTLGFGKSQLGSGYERKQHRKSGRTRCSHGSQRTPLTDLQEIQGWAPLAKAWFSSDSAEIRWKQIQNEIKPSGGGRVDWWLQG